MGESNAEEIIFSVRSGKAGDVGDILLNRPAALNALTYTMCESLTSRLALWQKDDSIKAVVIRGVGDKAFCAGGDVKSIVKYQDDIALAVDFFRCEYQMNRAIFHFSKPYISFLDGITMGGGAGVSLPGSHKIATERFSFAMPETTIGFFPDVGAGYFLNHCPGKIGIYLGLTGKRIGASDAFVGNLVDHIVPSHDLDTIYQAICATPLGDDSHDILDALFGKYKLKVNEPELMPVTQILNECFAASTIEKIFDGLSDKPSDWSNGTLRTLMTRSPTSLKVTLKHLLVAKKMSFDQVMQEDFTIVQGFLQGHDFYEGVRALLVDKDNKPTWKPANITEVDNSLVDSYFAEGGYSWT